MYYDIFLSNPQVTHEPGPDGTSVTMPGGNTGTVYAVSERESGFLHCLVTEEQLDQLGDDNFPFKTFDVAANRYKQNGNGPNHVFNPAGCVSRRGGVKYIHRVNAEEEEEIEEAAESMSALTQRRR